jgi:hypothetical protein
MDLREAQTLAPWGRDAGGGRRHRGEPAGEARGRTTPGQRLDNQARNS